MENMEVKSYRSISVVIPTLNCAKPLEACLKSIEAQKYPKEKVEILVVDGGSNDETKKVAIEHGAKFINGGYRDNMEARRGVGLKKAKNELIAVIDSDNILPTKNWFSQMVKPFNDVSDLLASQSWKYLPRADFSMYSRYCALMGVNDPVAYYLGKSERLTWFENKWKTGRFQDTPNYVVVEFNEKNLPTVGCNGFLAKRKLLLKSQCDPDNYFHIDVVTDCVALGLNKIAMVKNGIYHDTAQKISTLISKRVRYFNSHSSTHSNRRYLVFNPKNISDLLKLSVFAIFTVSIVPMLITSIRGYLYKRDLAWFLHPVVCYMFLIAYTVAYLKIIFKTLKI